MVLHLHVHEDAVGVIAAELQVRALAVVGIRRAGAGLGNIHAHLKTAAVQVGLDVADDDIRDGAGDILAQCHLVLVVGRVSFRGDFRQQVALEHKTEIEIERAVLPQFDGAADILPRTLDETIAGFFRGDLAAEHDAERVRHAACNDVRNICFHGRD